MKYCIIFDYEPDELSDIRDGAEVETIQTPIESIEISGVIRQLPPKMPLIQYDFETYQTGYAKGFNDLHDQLTGEYNNYDPEEDIEKNV